MEELTDGLPAVPTFVEKFEAGRSFDVEDDFAFIPELCTEEEVCLPFISYSMLYIYNGLIIKLPDIGLRSLSVSVSCATPPQIALQHPAVLRNLRHCNTKCNRYKHIPMPQRTIICLLPVTCS